MRPGNAGAKQVLGRSRARFFNRLEQFRGIATRYDNDPDNFLAAIELASARIWMRPHESAA